MGNRRSILVLLAGIGVCGLLLWGAQRRGRFFPMEGKAKSVLFEHTLDAAERLTVERGDARIELRRREGLWGMYAPFSARVDQGAVARIMDALESARVADAHSFQELRRLELPLKAFGLSPANAHVRVSGPQRDQALRVGALTPLGNEVYVLLEGVEQVLAVPAELLAVLPRTADDLRSRKLLHSDRALLRSLELRAPGKPFIKLSKETGTWRLVQPAAAPASDEKVEALLDALYDARVMRFVWPTVSNVMDVAEADSASKARMELYGFGADAAVQVSVQESSSAVPVKILFGHPLDEPAALHYALLQGGDAIGAVSNDVVSAFQLSPADLRDKRLFFERPGNVRRLQIHFGDLLFVLAQTNEVWQMQAPVSDAADQDVVRDTVEQLLRLKAETISDDVPSDSQRLVSEPGPPLSHVELVSDQTAWRFSIAADDFEGRYCRIAFTNSATVFRVASSNVPPALVSMVGLLGLRDKTVLSVQPASVRRITVKRGGGAVEVLQRENGGGLWRLGEGLTGQVATERLGVWLAQLGALGADRVEKLGLSPDDIDAHGLRVAWLEVSVDVDADDAVRKTLIVGKEAGYGKRYAMVRGVDVLFVLDESVLRVLSGRLVEPL